MTLAVTIYIIICILSVIVFLLQQTETGGMGIIGGSSNSLLGATRTTFLAKVATFFAILFFFSALFVSILSSGKNTLFQSDPAQILKPNQETKTSSTNTLNELELLTPSENPLDQTNEK